MPLSELWVEKYAPKSLDEVIGHEEVKELLKKLKGKDSIPPLLFYGPSGVGKTALAIAFLKEYFKGDLSKVRIIKGTYEKGVGTIRILYEDLMSGRYEAVLIKDVDKLTFDSQDMLRHCLDLGKAKVFIATTSNLLHVITPLRSRFIVLRLRRPKYSDILKLLKNICLQENIKVEDTYLEEIARLSNGDVRKAVNILQLLHEGKLTIDELKKVTLIDVQELKPLYEALMSLNISKCIDLAENLIKEGISAKDIIRGLSLFIKESRVLSNEAKAYLLRQLAEAEFKAVMGVDEFLVVIALIDGFVQVMRSMR